MGRKAASPGSTFGFGAGDTRPPFTSGFLPGSGRRNTSRPRFAHPSRNAPPPIHMARTTSRRVTSWSCAARPPATRRNARTPSHTEAAKIGTRARTYSHRPTSPEAGRNVTEATANRGSANSVRASRARPPSTRRSHGRRSPSSVPATSSPRPAPITATGRAACWRFEMKNASTWPGAPRITAWATATGGKGTGGISVWTTAEIARAAAALVRPATAPAPGPARSSGADEGTALGTAPGPEPRLLFAVLLPTVLLWVVVPRPGRTVTPGAKWNATSTAIRPIRVGGCRALLEGPCGKMDFHGRRQRQQGDQARRILRVRRGRQRRQPAGRPPAPDAPHRVGRRARRRRVHPVPDGEPRRPARHVLGVRRVREAGAGGPDRRHGHRHHGLRDGPPQGRLERRGHGLAARRRPLDLQAPAGERHRVPAEAPERMGRLRHPADLHARAVRAALLLLVPEDGRRRREPAEPGAEQGQDLRPQGDEDHVLGRGRRRRAGRGI